MKTYKRNRKYLNSCNFLNEKKIAHVNFFISCLSVIMGRIKNKISKPVTHAIETHLFRDLNQSFFFPFLKMKKMHLLQNLLNYYQKINISSK